MKALVVLSGGMDSATALAKMVDLYGKGNIVTATFNYGSKHNDRENRFAAELAKYYGVENFLIRMPFINDLFASDLLKSGGAVPEGHYEEQTMKRTVVPFRNGIMLSIATGLAESKECDLVALGNHKGDHAIYPDCRSEFTKPMAEAMFRGTYRGVTLIRPLENFTKADIAKQGSILGVPYELTYSCYAGGEMHCGRCGTCIERMEAFEMAGVPDPTLYADRALYEQLKDEGRIGLGPTPSTEDSETHSGTEHP